MLQGPPELTVTPAAEQAPRAQLHGLVRRRAPTPPNDAEESVRVAPTELRRGRWERET